MTDSVRLKIMYLNPIGTPDYDEVFATMARENKHPETEVHITSLKPSDGAFTHIEYRSYEAIVTTGIVRAARAAAREGFHGMAIGCFYDTALHEAREVSETMVVTAPCAAALGITSCLANRVGIIVGRRKWVDQMHATVVANGMGSRLSGFYHVELGVNDFQVDHVRTEKLLIEAGKKAVEDDYAEALILGCTLEIGFYHTMSERLGVPVIDPSIAAFKQAEYAADLRRKCGWIPSRKWSCESPPEDEIHKFGIICDSDVFGNRIIVPGS